MASSLFHLLYTSRSFALSDKVRTGADQEVHGSTLLNSGLSDGFAYCSIPFDAWDRSVPIYI